MGLINSCFLTYYFELISDGRWKWRITMYELMEACSQSAVIKVMGVGGGGGNAVSHMLDGNIEGVDFICVNTDAQALKNNRVKTLLQILMWIPSIVI